MRLKSELQRNQRLLKIAKPVDLPFAKNPQDKNPDEQNKMESKKKQLPLIGKRNQFSKFKIVKPSESAVLTKSAKPKVHFASDEEEVEDDAGNSTEHMTKGDGEREIKIKDVSEQIEESEKDQNKLTDISKNVTTESKSSKENQTDEHSKQSPSKLEIANTSKTMVHETAENSNTTQLPVESSKKRRQRNRQRGKREVDVDDDIEYESTEKYAKWVPPENQTGDGFTELNKKYGY